MGRGIMKNTLLISSLALSIILLLSLVDITVCSVDMLDYIEEKIALDEINGYIGIQLPKTGQTTCYDTAGNLIACSGTGQDGDLQKGVSWPVPRFTNNGDGTTTDNLTGLMWVESGNLMVTRDPTFDNDDTVNDGNVTWQHALDYVENKLNTESYAGYQDWRLPNMFELESLLNKDESDVGAWLNTQGFISVEANYYWSSTTNVSNTTGARVVSLLAGNLFVFSKESSYRPVFAVRSEQTKGTVSLPKTGQQISYSTGDDGDLEKGITWSNPRFIEESNGILIDKLTGLLWQQTPSSTTMTWTAAMTYANDLVIGNYSDWRIPNSKEIESLFNYGETDIAVWLNGQGFNNIQSLYFWTATNYMPDARYVWFISLLNGNVGDTFGNKTGTNYVLTVSDG